MSSDCRCGSPSQRLVDGDQYDRWETSIDGEPQFIRCDVEITGERADCAVKFTLYFADSYDMHAMNLAYDR